MKFTDATGKELRPGQMVHLAPTGRMLTGFVSELNPGNMLAGPGIRPTPPFIVVSVVMQLISGPDGQLEGTYVVRDVESRSGVQDPFSMPDEETERKPN